MVTWLPWQPQCYVYNSFVMSPIEIIFGIKLPQDKIDISDIFIAMVTWLPCQPQYYVNNSLVFSPIEVIFGMNFLRMIGTSHTPCCYGN